MQFAYKPHILRSSVRFHNFVLNEVGQLNYFDSSVIG